MPRFIFPPTNVVAPPINVGDLDDTVVRDLQKMAGDNRLVFETLQRLVNHLTGGSPVLDKE